MASLHRRLRAPDLKLPFAKFLSLGGRSEAIADFHLVGKGGCGFSRYQQHQALVTVSELDLASAELPRFFNDCASQNIFHGKT